MYDTVEKKLPGQLKACVIRNAGMDGLSLDVCYIHLIHYVI